MSTVYHLFEGFGIELEYMIVDRSTTAVRPIADRLFAEVAGEGAAAYDPGIIGWSNELARHVIEVKNGEPVPDLAVLPALFHEQILSINRRLAARDCMLMPGGMHPLMDPLRESALWPVDDENIYHTYDRIFNCKGHGWTNLQSIHCNLPFAGDEEFGRLHTAVRLVLPLLPALCASTPFTEGKASGIMNNRLEFYRNNQKAVPLVTGHVIPEAVFSRDQYEKSILTPMYRQIAPYDPDNIVQYEWLNSRGAIARFDRMAIEIRLMDIQECPAMDIAVCALVIAVIRALCDGRWSTMEEQAAFSETDLETILLAAISTADATKITDAPFLKVLGRNGVETEARALWESLANELLPPGHFARQALSVIFGEGTLARRMLDATGPAPTVEQLTELNLRLCACLRENVPYA